MPSNPVRGAVDSLANSRDRSAQHILVGLGITVGAVAAAALLAKVSSRADEDAYEAYSDYEPAEWERPQARPAPKLLSNLWPPIFMALTLSGLRVWNAPASAARTQALTLWGMAQGLNAVWMALGPKRLGGQMAAAIASVGTAAAYVWRARQVDPTTAALVTPYMGWIGVANALSEQLAPKTPEARTFH
ncbi:TspO/MBR family protein [Phenylobacterium sp.]|jgi:tryptophan-rich sensory protein|uniref:TspO/MBR family protein n=1 Tax=Phenylobacterium sp. TaxID=1871053 RepID=UPI002F3F446F